MTTTPLENKINQVIETFVSNRNVFDENDFIESKRMFGNLLQIKYYQDLIHFY